MRSIGEHEFRQSPDVAPPQRLRGHGRSPKPNHPRDDGERYQRRETADVFRWHTGPIGHSGAWFPPLSRMSAVLFTFGLATSWLLSEPAHAYVCVQNYYVDSANGKDSNPGSATQPWRTINHASWNRLAGDCVNARPGIYVETPVATVAPGQGASKERGYFVLRSVNPGSAKIQAPLGANVGDVLMIQSDYVIVQGFEVDGRISQRGAAGACISSNWPKNMRALGREFCNKLEPSCCMPVAVLRRRGWRRTVDMPLRGLSRPTISQ